MGKPSRLLRTGVIAGGMVLLVACAELPTEHPTANPAAGRQAASREPFTEAEMKAYAEISKRLTPLERGQYLSLPTRKARMDFLRERGLLQ